MVFMIELDKSGHHIQQATLCEDKCSDDHGELFGMK
jgi:hypothetical protein